MRPARKLVILTARQLGISWLSLAYALWLLIYHAPATVLLFSLREAESKKLLWRLKGMYERLPAWMQARQVVLSNETRWMLSNSSRALAFSTRSGRSYTGTLALVDKADFVPELCARRRGCRTIGRTPYALVVAGVAWKGAGGVSAVAVAEDPVVGYDRREEW